MTVFTMDKYVGLGMKALESDTVTYFNHWAESLDTTGYMWGIGFDVPISTVSSTVDPLTSISFTDDIDTSSSLFAKDDFVVIPGAEMPSMYPDDDGWDKQFGILQMSDFAGHPSGGELLYYGKTKIIVNNHRTEEGYVPGLTGHGVEVGHKVRLFDNIRFPHETFYDILFIFDNEDGATPDYIVIDRDAPLVPIHTGWVRVYK